MPRSLLKFLVLWSGVLLLIPSSSALALDMESLVQSRLSKDGTTLDLTRKKIRTAGARQLAQMEALKGVTTLLLEGNQIKKEGMEALAQSPHLAQLKHLDLWGNFLGDLGLQALVDTIPRESTRRILRLVKSTR